MRKTYGIYIFLTVFVSQIAFGAALKSVSLQLKWKNRFQFAGYYMAKEKGFYKDVGLKVKINEYKQGVNVVDEVLSGRATFGIGDSSLITDRAKGRDIVLLAAILQSSPAVFLSLKSSGIKSVKDFAGKNIMMKKKGAKSVEILSMLFANGVKINEVHFINKIPNIKYLLDKKADIISAYSYNKPFELDKRGIEYDVWDPKNFGFDFYNDILFTSSKTVDTNQTIVRDFTKASLRGWQYAFSHISETLDVIIKKYNTQHKSRKALFYEAIKLKELAYKNSKKIGLIKKDKIQRIYDIYRFMGLVKHKIDMDKFLYDVHHKENFTNRELNYIADKKIVNICINPNWKPIEFKEKDKPKGISIDILNLAFSKVGLKYHYIKTTSWKESQKFLKEKKCDILPSAVKTKKRLKFANFTKPYMKFALVIVTRKDKPLVQDIKSIVHYTMARKKGSALIEIFKRKYPGIKIIETKGYKEAFEYVENGKAYFTVATIPVLSYYKNMYDFNDLQIAGYLHKNYKLSVAVRKDDKILLSIMQKSFDKVSDSTKDIVIQKWIDKKFIKKVQYTHLWIVVAIAMFILTFMTFRNLVIKKYNLKLQKSITKIKAELEDNQKQLLQQSRLAQMGEMISMIAHQWRQPLTAINATASSLQLKEKLGKLDSKYILEQTENIIKYSKYLSETIDDFRNFFKPDKEKRETNLNSIVKSVVNIVNSSVQSNKIKLILDLKCQKTFKSYPNELKQVLLNLIKNAEDALIDKDIKNPYIKIKSYAKDKKIILEVSDNAGGIPEDIIDKIFDPYFSTKTKKDGTGLGLYMSKTIIKEHCGGDIKVKNEDKGVVFKIILEVNDE